MNYFKGVLIGFGTVLLGAPTALVIWVIWRSSQGEAPTVSFTSMGLANHLAHSLAFGFSSLCYSLRASCRLYSSRSDDSL